MLKYTESSKFDLAMEDLHLRLDCLIEQKDVMDQKINTLEYLAGALVCVSFVLGFILFINFLTSL